MSGRSKRANGVPARRAGLAALLAGTCLLAGSAGAAAATRATPVSGWLTWGNDTARTGQATAALPAAGLKPLWLLRLRGRITGQVLAVRDVPTKGDTTLYVATSAGFVYSVSKNGYLRWRVDIGQAANPCPQLDGYGVTGTPAIDGESRTLYVAGPFGRVHALDLVTGGERAGWPVRLYEDVDTSLVWGAVTLVGGDLYVPTASFCDNPMIGKLFRVSLADRQVTSWTAVPEELGGGGGIWGWGGSAYSATRDSVLVATGNAFAGGSNVGPGFSEAAGYGEQLIELSRDLGVRAASHPEPFPAGIDIDLVGSPVVANVRGCGELVAVLNKAAWVYGWRSDAIGGPPAFALELPRSRPGSSVTSQLAWSASANAFFAVTDEQLARVDVDAACRGSIGWARELGADTASGSPTVAGALVWLPMEGTGSAQLLAIDAATGTFAFRSRLGGPAFTAPTVIDRRLYLGAFNGVLHAYGVGQVPGATATPSAAALRAAARTGRSSQVSWVDSKRGWVALPTGVYSTDDGGRRWRRIWRLPASRIARTSKDAGVIATGIDPGPCNCDLRVLVTRDGGRTWRRTTAIGARFSGRGPLLYWWHDSSLYQVAGWPGKTIAAKRLESLTDGFLADAALVPGGVAVLVSSRVSGTEADNAPRLIVRRGGRREVLTLPEYPGRHVVARSVSVAWPRIVVRGTTYEASDAAGATRVTWESRDGGATWTTS